MSDFSERNDDLSARERGIETSPLIRFHIRNTFGILLILGFLIAGILVIMALDFNRHETRERKALESDFRELGLLNRTLNLAILERERAQNEEKKTAVILDQAISQSPSGIIIADADLSIQRANKAAFDIRGDAETDSEEVDIQIHFNNWQISAPVPGGPERRYNPKSGVDCQR